MSPVTRLRGIGDKGSRSLFVLLITYMTILLVTCVHLYQYLCFSNCITYYFNISVTYDLLVLVPIYYSFLLYTECVTDGFYLTLFTLIFIQDGSTSGVPPSWGGLRREALHSQDSWRGRDVACTEATHAPEGPPWDERYAPYIQRAGFLELVRVVNAGLPNLDLTAAVDRWYY
jgi:hypothetical protein